jgi:hypothetical protein
MAILVLLASMFLILSFMMFAAHRSINEYRIEQYEELPDCKDALQQLGKYCKLPITVHRLMQQPIYVLYHLNNFYQNHRAYVNSKSKEQLAGKVVSYEEAKS